MSSVVIVGGGVVGLCAAYYTAAAGCRVTVLERGAPDHGGCSLGNAGMITPSHFIPLASPGTLRSGLRLLMNPTGPFALRPRPDPEFLRWLWLFRRSATAAPVRRSAPLLLQLGLASRRAFQELARELEDDFGLTEAGLLMLCKEERTLHEEAEVAAQARALGLEAEVLTCDEAMRLEDGLRLDVAGTVYFPGDCHLDPRRLMAALARAVEARGARICWETAVTGWRQRGDRIEAAVASASRRQPPGGEFPADQFVVAGGSWSGELLRRAGIRLPLQAGKGYSITLPQPPRLPRIGAILLEARVAVTPMGSALRFAGTMDFAGLDLAVDFRRVEGMRRSIPPCLPDFSARDFRGQPVWSGLRPCSPDGLPYVGRCRDISNLVVATGHAMLGVSLAPVTGRLVAEILAGGQPSIDINALRPERFGGG